MIRSFTLLPLTKLQLLVQAAQFPECPAGVIYADPVVIDLYRQFPLDRFTMIQHQDGDCQH